ncbi:MAG: class I SAM-dependent methyltransferase [Ferruginibacter sp.]|nr:class I SAM-dependent methyltransferase [Ferruginibacter sp.]
MYLGLREVFDYQKCANCGCMQLLDVPLNLAKYYPADKYYSFDTGNKKFVKTDVLRKIKAAYILYGKNKLAGSLLSIGYKIPEFFEWLKIAGVEFDDAILDVGCGGGGLLFALCKNGFTKLSGIDPFNQDDLDYGSFKIYKKEIFEMDGQYDFIMLNHVFEHIDNPLPMLIKLYELLKPGRFLLIRTPVMGTYAWAKYRENWMALDAPRHLIIHTVKSMQLLATEAGFSITKTVFDGNGFSLIGSEQYKRDIPLVDIKSRVTNKKSTLFTPQQITDYKAIAEKTNHENNGDQAAFYLYKPA